MKPLALGTACALAFLLLISVANLAPGTTGSGQDAVKAAFVGYRVVQHPLPVAGSQPWTITTDPAGRIWFVEQAGNRIGMFDPSSGSFSEFRIPTRGALPQGISVDPGGNVWFVEVNASRLGELPSGSDSILEFGIPRGTAGLACGPVGVTATAVRVWITCEFSNQIDEFNPATRSYEEFPLPVAFSAPLMTLFDAEGNFWFTAADSNMLGYVTTAELRNGTSAGIDEFAPVNQTYPWTFSSPVTQVLLQSSLEIPSQIAFSPDGSSIWITEHGASTFDRLDVSSRVLVKYWTPKPESSSYPNSLPNGVAVDSSGIVWMAVHYGNAIARFDPSSSQLIEYQIPCCSGGLAATLYLTLGGGGTVWFTEFNGNALGELIPDSSVLGPSIMVSAGAATVGSSASITALFTLSLPNSARSPEAAHLSVTGITGSGSLQNATASFYPQQMELTPGTNSTSQIRISTGGLRPGAYYLTVSARLEGLNATESLLIMMNVQGGQSLGQLELLYALAVGAVASAGVVGVLAYGSRRRLRTRTVRFVS